MIDLNRLMISKGDVVQRREVTAGLTAIPFTVDRVEIDATGHVQWIYPEVGPPVDALDLIVITKRDSGEVTTSNKIALTEILDQIYGDRWDIISKDDFGYNEYLSENYQYILIIYYDEITIKNSKNNEYKIRDLYVFIPLSHVYKTVGSNLYGTRTTVTQSEVAAQYAHSHLSRSTYIGNIGGKISTFCTGEDIIDEMRSITNTTYPKDNRMGYELFFETLNTYVAWESLEGGPYIKMDTINNTTTLIKTINISPKLIKTDSEEHKRFTDYMINKGFEIPFNLKYTCSSLKDFNEVIIINKDIFSSKLVEFIIENYDEMVSNNIPLEGIFDDRHTRKQYINKLLIEYMNRDIESTNRDTFTIISRSNTRLTFRGQIVPYTIITYNNDINISIENITINYRLLMSLIHKFKTAFYDNYWRDEAGFFEKLAQSRD